MIDTKNEWPEEVRVSFSKTGSFEGIVWRFGDAAIKPEGGAVVTYIRCDIVRELELQAIRAALLFAHNESENAGQNILDIDPQEILENLK